MGESVGKYLGCTIELEQGARRRMALARVSENAFTYNFNGWR